MQPVNPQEKGVTYSFRAEMEASKASVDDDGITLKRFYPMQDFIELRPCNSSMGPIRTRDCRIHGKLVLLVRSY